MSQDKKMVARKGVGMKKQVGLSVAFATLALMLTACNRSDTSMQEAFWCASYGTCKPSAPQAAPARAAAVDSASFCSYYGNCAQQPARAPAYDTCSFYGICDRGS